MLQTCIFFFSPFDVAVGQTFLKRFHGLTVIQWPFKDGSNEVGKVCTTCSKQILVADDVLSVSRQVTESSGSASIRFGGNANQVYHTFRHVDEMGLDRTMVQEAVRNNIGAMSSQIVPGKPFIQIITVDGQKIQYNAYMLPNGTINVGRINGVP